MNLATIIVILILVIICFFIIRGMVKKVKEGKDICGCSGDCGKCKGCH